MTIEGDVVAGYVFGAVLLGHEVVKQAFAASVRTGWIAVVGTGERVLEDRCRAPGRAVPVAVATLFEKVQLIPQYFEHITLIFRHLRLLASPRSLRFFCLGAIGSRLPILEPHCVLRAHRAAVTRLTCECDV